MTSLKKNPSFIVTQTPLRVSFAGGGTDLPDFYEREHGAVISTAITRFIYVTLKNHDKLFEENYRLNYSETEHVDALDEIKNTIARECLRLVPINPPVYISTVADLPAFSGLGSSSAFAVGLLNALHAYRGESVTPGQLAEEAAHIEIDVLKRPIGKQDHYAAAFGGLNYFKFKGDGRVTIEPQTLPNAEIRNLFENIMLFWTNIRRDAASVLSEQKKNTADNMEVLIQLKNHAQDLRDSLSNGFNAVRFGDILNTGWQFKKSLASGISNTQINTWYETAIRAGAYGGKLCGAGGGGFLLFLVSPEKQSQVRKALSDMEEVKIGYEAQGSRTLLIH